jgi:hypothetical protein
MGLVAPPLMGLVAPPLMMLRTQHLFAASLAIRAVQVAPEGGEILVTISLECLEHVLKVRDRMLKFGDRSLVSFDLVEASIHPLRA